MLFYKPSFLVFIASMLAFSLLQAELPLETAQPQISERNNSVIEGASLQKHTSSKSKKKKKKKGGGCPTCD